MLKLLLFILIVTNLSFANWWNDLWLNKNQQGILLLNKDNPKDAADTFINKDWKAVSYYKSKDYNNAYEYFKNNKTAIGYYNQGNSLAKMNKIDEAIDAYQNALKIQSDFEDALYNLNLLRQIKKNQDKQDKKDKKNKNQKKQDQNKKDQKKNILVQDQEEKMIIKI